MKAAPTIPKWKRGDLSDRLGDYWYAEAIYEREVDDVYQVVERIVPRAGSTNAYFRPMYRLVEIRDGKPEKIPTPAADTQRDVRNIADRRAHRILRGRSL